MTSLPSLGLYIHIPFCQARCGYCDFVTFTGKEAEQQVYVDSLCRELERQAKELVVGRPLSTVFFGGGTPTLLSPEQIAQVLNAVRSLFRLTPACEITFEANPESVNAEKLRAWREAGANRISLGLQALNDRLLKSMDRLHSVEGFLKAFQLARAEGFDNLNVDLIYGFPEQRFQDWKDTVVEVTALSPEHLSLYALTVEAHTPFAERGVTTDNDQQAEQYAWARAFLSKAGYAHYEVSNFSRPGKACEHNLLYWRQQDYLGAGVGAVGCVEGLRWQNEKNLGPYRKAIEANRWPRQSEEHLDAKTQKFERLMLGLRLREGLSWETLNEPAWNATREKLAAQGLLEEWTPGRWRVTEAGLPILNQVLLPFL